MKRLAILISSAGTGSTLKAIIDEINSGKLQAEISVVMSDAADTRGFAWVQDTTIPTHIFDSNAEKLEKLLTETYPTDYIVLTGWKKIVSDETIAVFANRILNIHPGLIPDAVGGVVKNPDGTDGLWNKGKFMTVAIQNFLDMHATYAGSTVHLLSHDFDFGPVLERCFVKVEPSDTVDSLYKRLKTKEHEIYIEALKKLCNTE